MEVDDRVATWTNRLEDTPEPFRGALQEHLSPQDSIDVLAFSPAHTSLGVRSPATLLSVTSRGWLVVSDGIEGRTTVAEYAFDDTLLVELTEILLYGQLKIDHVAGGKAQACVIEFNTVMDKLYREAVRLILRRVEGGSAAAASPNPGAAASLETWPIQFRSAVLETLLDDTRPLAAVQWPAVYDGFRRELAPASALLMTNRELLLLSEEMAWARGPRLAKYGYIATYYPLVRLARYDIRPNKRVSILELKMHASHGGETMQVLFPPESEDAVAHVLDCALGRPSTAYSTPGAP